MQVKSSLDNIKPDCELVVPWEGMQQHDQAESQGSSILQIIINNWYLVLHFPPTQQTGWGHSVLKMLFLAMGACKRTPQNAELDASLQKKNYFGVNGDFLFPVDIIPSTAPSCWAPQHILPFATVAASQGHQRLLGQARMFRTLCKQMVLWKTPFCKMGRKETFLSCQIWLKPSRLWEDLWLQGCMGSTGDGRRSTHVKFEGVNIQLIPRWSHPEGLGLSWEWFCAAAVVWRVCIRAMPTAWEKWGETGSLWVWSLGQTELAWGFWRE